jgi:hypothetical protein
LQGFIREYHQRHHLLTGGLSTWWKAVGLKWNDPAYFLELPSMLHLRGLHRRLAKLDPVRFKKLRTAFTRQLADEWNVQWQLWFATRLPSWLNVKKNVKNVKRTHLTALRQAMAADPTLKATVQADITGAGIKHQLAFFTALTGVPLKKYYVKKYDPDEHLLYLLQLAELEKDLKKAKTDAQWDKAIADWQLWILGGEPKIKKKATRKWWK